MSSISVPTNLDDLIDSRDVIEALQNPEHQTNELVALAEEAEQYSEDWQYGATLVRDSYFAEYARELAEDIGAITGDEPWPTCCIDWASAARELRQDYTSVEFDGVTYWTR